VLIPALTAALLLLSERAAFAYVDPGTGSLLYQTALTIVLGLGLVFRRVRGSIVEFVKRLGGPVGPPDGGPTSQRWSVASRSDATDSDRATPHQH
jgi:hypothetical protein